MAIKSEAAKERGRARSLAYHHAHKDDPEYRAKRKAIQQAKNGTRQQESHEYYVENRDERMAYAEAYRAAHREQRLAYQREYYQKNQDKLRIAMQEYRQTHRDEVSHRNRRRNYGVSPEQYAALLKEQNDACAICERPETALRKGKPRSICVDHDHETGRVRGLLCSDCNRAVGLLNDDIRLLARASYYLEAHRPIPE